MDKYCHRPAENCKARRYKGIIIHNYGWGEKDSWIAAEAGSRISMLGSVIERTEKDKYFQRGRIFSEHGGSGEGSE